MCCIFEYDDLLFRIRAIFCIFWCTNINLGLKGIRNKQLIVSLVAFINHCKTSVVLQMNIWVVESKLSQYSNLKKTLFV